MTQILTQIFKIEAMEKDCIILKSLRFRTVQSNFLSGDSIGNRTRVTAVKGRCLDRLTMEPYLIYANTI